MRTGTSYLSQSPQVLHFGTGALDRLDKLEIRWPSGKRQEAPDLLAGRRLVFYETPGAESTAN